MASSAAPAQERDDELQTQEAGCAAGLQATDPQVGKEDSRSVSPGITLGADVTL